MLKPLSDTALLMRHDLDADAWVLASGVTGTFVAFGGDGDYVQPTAGGFAIPVWSESNRDQTAGWSPDVHGTGKVTGLYGKLRAVTDQFTGTPSVGDKLYVDANGKLTTSATGDEVVLAICTKASHTVEVLSTNYTAIEFITL